MKFTRFLRFSLCDSIIEFRSKSEIEIQILVLNSFSKKGRQRLLLDGLVLQEDGSVRSRYFVGQSEDEVEVRCEVSRRVKIAVSRYSGPSGLRLRCGGCYSYQFLILICSPGLCSQPLVPGRGLEGTSRKAASTYVRLGAQRSASGEHGR